MADSGGGIVDPYPSASRVFGATEKSIGESGVAPIDPSDVEGVLFSHNFIGTLLALASEVTIDELIAVEVLMDTTVRSFKDGEGKAREASDVDFIGGKARGGANGIVIGRRIRRGEDGRPSRFGVRYRPWLTFGPWCG